MPRRSEEPLARVSFPPYVIQMLTSRHILVGGGGGAAKTGVPNGFEIFELGHDGHRFVAKRISSYDTGPNVVMNCAVHTDGKRTWLVAGQESDCQLYQVQSQVVAKENGVKNTNSDNGLRKRKKIEEIGGKKRLQMILKPGDSIKTDFGECPLQRVVRINPKGNLIATGGIDGHIRLWAFPKMTKCNELKGHTNEIDDIDFSLDGKTLATVAKDGLLILWNVVTGKKQRELKWNPDEDRKFVFKRCRFLEKLFAISNSFALKNSKTKSVHSGFLTSWNLDSGTVQKVVKFKETLSELAVSDDTKFVAVGTMFTGTVDIFIAFSLQRVLHVPAAHNMFVTSLQFLPTASLDGPTITSDAETAVLSVSVDNRICVHSIAHRKTMPMWLLTILLVLFLFAAFTFCSFMDI